MTKKIAIIQARMGSSRFPGKVLKKLKGRTVIEWVVEGASKISNLDKIIVATSDTKQDKAITDWCLENGISYYCGSESDVLKRYLDVAISEKADVILRLTADCPLIDPSICDEVLMSLQLSGADYVCNFDPRSYPDGMDCEAMTISALLMADKNATSEYDREHVTTYIRANRCKYRIVFNRCPLPNVQDLCWTVDDPEDIEHLDVLLSRLDHNEKRPSWTDLLSAEFNKVMLNSNEEKNKSDNENIHSPNNCSDRYEKSNTLFNKATKYIPLASQTISKSYIQYPVGQSPLYLTHGNLGRVWDVDGNEYVDLVNGLLPIVLGYRDPDVDNAIMTQLSRGISFSLSTELEIQLSEELVKLIPSAEMVRLGKSGSDATTAAVRVARSFTGRERIAVCGYHGWHDWYIGTTSRNIGVPKCIAGLSHRFNYDDIHSLEELLEKHKGEFAAIIMEPVNSQIPKENYLQQVKELTHKHGALLIFDEIITGFRISMGGAQEYFNVTPDLSCFGKSMGNGMPISALVGRIDVMSNLEDVFVSGTHSGECLSIAAALAVIQKMNKEFVIDKLWETGEKLFIAVDALINSTGTSEYIQFKGLSPWKMLNFTNCPGSSAESIKTFFIREMLKEGVLISASHNISFAHNEDDIELIVNAYKKVLPQLKHAIENQGLDSQLGKNIINPVFAVR